MVLFSLKMIKRYALGSALILGGCSWHELKIADSALSQSTKENSLLQAILMQEPSYRTSVTPYDAYYIYYAMRDVYSLEKNDGSSLTFVHYYGEREPPFVNSLDQKLPSTRFGSKPPSMLCELYVDNVKETMQFEDYDCDGNVDVLVHFRFKEDYYTEEYPKEGNTIQNDYLNALQELASK